MFLQAKKNIKTQPNFANMSMVSNNLFEIVWTTLIIGRFSIDYQLVNLQLRTKFHIGQITDNQRKSMFILDKASICSWNLVLFVSTPFFEPLINWNLKMDISF
jgi:hypothetical protein